MTYHLEEGVIQPVCCDGVTTYVISSHQVWLPGSYASERAARYAFRFRHADLQALQDSVNPGGTITFTMLQDLRRQIRTTNDEPNLSTVRSGGRCREHDDDDEGIPLAVRLDQGWLTDDDLKTVVRPIRRGP